MLSDADVPLASLSKTAQKIEHLQKNFSTLWENHQHFKANADQKIGQLKAKIASLKEKNARLKAKALFPKRRSWLSRIFRKN